MKLRERLFAEIKATGWGVNPNVSDGEKVAVAYLFKNRRELFYKMNDRYYELKCFPEKNYGLYLKFKMNSTGETE